jgi:hypothetical protein
MVARTVCGQRNVGNLDEERERRRMSPAARVFTVDRRSRSETWLRGRFVILQL